MRLGDVERKGEHAAALAADLVVQGRDKVVRRRVGLLVPRPDRRIDPDAVNAVVYDTELPLALLNSSQRGDPKLAR